MPGETYSFLNVVATITGPGGSFPIGAGAAPSEEGISVEMVEDKTDVKVGADGTIQYSLRASRLARITVRLLKTSPTNALLSALYNFQSQSASLWGQNVLVVSDVQRGDVIASAICAFMRQPRVDYGKDAGMNEWLFTGNVSIALGTGTPVAG